MKEQENLFFLNFFVSILFNLICGLQIHLKAGNCFLKIKKGRTRQYLSHVSRLIFANDLL